MADKTKYKDDLPRAQVAELLDDLADELRGEGPATVAVGNKRVTLSPDAQISYDLTVAERSPMLKGKREEISLELGWRVPQDQSQDRD